FGFRFAGASSGVSVEGIFAGPLPVSLVSDASLLVVLGPTACSARDAQRNAQAPRRPSPSCVHQAFSRRHGTVRASPGLNRQRLLGGGMEVGCWVVEWKYRTGAIEPTLQVWNNGQAQESDASGRGTSPS